MARKEITITLDESAGRDSGKVFHIREMSADRAEGWAIRALLALAGGGGKEIPGLDPSRGMEGLSSVKATDLLSGMLGGLSWDVVKPLMDELLSCVSIVDPNKPSMRMPLKPDTVGNQIEEVKTLLKLRLEVLQLHLGFSGTGGLLNSLQAMVGGVGSPNTGTSAG